MSDNLINLFMPLSLFQPVFLIAHEQGVARERLLPGTGINSNAFTGTADSPQTDRSAQISLSQARALLMHASELVGDGALPLNAGNRMQPAMFGRMGFLLTNSRNLRHAFELRAKFSQAISAQITETLIDDGDTFRLCVVDPPGHSVPPVLDRCLVEYQLAMLNRISVVLPAMDDVATAKPIEASFRHPRPSHLAAYQKLFGQNLHFNQPSNWLRYEQARAEKPLPYADASVAAELENAIQAELRHRTKTGLLAQLSSEIRAQLNHPENNGLPGAEQIAKRMNITRSTLHRRLKSQGTHFSAVRETVLHDKALELFKNGGLTINDIAQQLGYADSSTFDHAFHRWTGVSPSQWRSRAELTP